MSSGISGLATTALLAMAMGVGCQGGESYNLGQKAEQKGDPATAYDQYTRAAARNRSGVVGDGLARTRLAAAAHAERAGLTAMDEGRYDDAWRSFMRTLDIQPDHATAVQLVRQLESDYPNEIAHAKWEWMTRGVAALSVPEERVLAMAPPPPPQTTETQAPSPTPTAVARVMDPPPPRTAETSAPTPILAAASPVVDPPGATVIASQPPDEIWPALRMARQSSRQELIVPPATPAPVVEDPPREDAPVKKTPNIKAIASRQPDEISPPPKAAKKSSPRPKRAPKTSRARPVRTYDIEPLEPTAPPDFTSIHTLSIKDRRYNRLALAIDGIGVKLKDTEGEGEADLDLFEGKKRIQKVRDLELGRSQTFRGKSGTLYRLTLLGVHHKSNTVRLGVKRA